MHGRHRCRARGAVVAVLNTDLASVGGGELRSECLPGGVRRDARASRPASARLLFDEMRSRLRAMGRPQGSDGVPVLLAQPSFHADMLG
jgi:hypothetical protein